LQHKSRVCQEAYIEDLRLHGRLRCLFLPRAAAEMFRLMVESRGNTLEPLRIFPLRDRIGLAGGAGWPVSRVLSASLRTSGDHSSGPPVAEGFARPTRATGRECPCVSGRNRSAGRPYSALLPVGFAMPPPSPGARWALAPPFHPCRGKGFPLPRRSALCGTFPGVSPAGRWPAPLSRGARTFLRRCVATSPAVAQPPGAGGSSRGSAVGGQGGVARRGREEARCCLGACNQRCARPPHPALSPRRGEREKLVPRPKSDRLARRRASSSGATFKWLRR